MDDTVLGIPINRFITFIKPGINLVAGLVAAWLVAKVNIVGVLGITVDDAATQVSAGITLLLTTGLLQLGDLKWIKGHHLELESGGLEIRATPPDQVPEETDETQSMPEFAKEPVDG